MTLAAVARTRGGNRPDTCVEIEFAPRRFDQLGFIDHREHE
jgi:hypothetical protein